MRAVQCNAMKYPEKERERERGRENEIKTKRGRQPRTG